MSTLYLVPNLLTSEANPLASLPPGVLSRVQEITRFAVENEKSARRFLKMCGIPAPFEGIEMEVVDKRTPTTALAAILNKWKGLDIGILSESGCPAIADPGAALVALAHEKGWTVKPLVGPSSILLALMGSGFNGQGFTFHGYLPVNSAERITRLRELEAVAHRSGYTQVFIETPFRNEPLLADIIRALRPETLLSISANLMVDGEIISTKPVTTWAKNPPNLKNIPAVFSIGVAATAGLKAR